MSSLIPFGRNRNRNEIAPYDFFRSMFTEPFFNELSAFPGVRMIRADVRDNGKEYLVEAELPGVSRDRIQLEVQDGVLTISANEEVEQKDEREGYVYRERRVGRMSRSFSLDGVREEGIAAEYRDGVLFVHLPKSDEPKKRSRIIDIR